MTVVYYLQFGSDEDANIVLISQDVDKILEYLKTHKNMLKYKLTEHFGEDYIMYGQTQPWIYYMEMDIPNTVGAEEYDGNVSDIIMNSVRDLVDRVELNNSAYWKSKK